jgi:DNA-binding response OmpR family regulator
MKNILLIEDDPEISKLLDLHLSSDEYNLTTLSNGQEALNLIMTNDLDLIILDIALPGLNGLEVCKKVRQHSATIPIMMLTCHNEESDKVLALELGADDYVTKPFSILELIARTKALLRRGEHILQNGHIDKEEINFKELVLNATKRKACIKGQRLELTPKEFDLLLLLANNPGKTFSRFELLEQVWGVAFSGYEHTITSHINRLRIKLETDLHHPQYILTAWGTGYRFAE